MTGLKAFALATMVLAGSCLFSMDQTPDQGLEDFELVIEQDPNNFNPEYANSIQSNYSLLFPYLERHVDKVRDYGAFSNEPIHNWITYKALGDNDPEHLKNGTQSDVGGNVIALYYMVRNHLKKSNLRNRSAQELLKDEDFAASLFGMILCLQRIAFDIIIHYITHHDESVFNVYSIFKKKFHYLYKHFLPIGFSSRNLLKLSHLGHKSIEYWKTMKWYHHEFPCEWVTSCNWYYPNIPGCWSLWFGDSQASNCLQQSEDMKVHESPITQEQRNQAFLLVAKNFADLTVTNTDFTIAPKHIFWDDFLEEYSYFKSFPFHYKKEDLEIVFFPKPNM